MNEITIGMQVHWKSANRTETGVVEAMRTIDLKDKPVKREYEVKMGNGRTVIVPESSIRL